MVVINRGYVILSIQKELPTLVCPCCKTGNKTSTFDPKPLLDIKNCGFVNCEWIMRGILKSNKDSKIYADGRTYDNKLYTFKENDYRQIWTALDIVVKQLDPKNHWNNIPSARFNQNNRAIDEALQNQGVGKLLDSNGFEIQDTDKFENEFLNKIQIFNNI